MRRIIFSTLKHLACRTIWAKQARTQYSNRLHRCNRTWQRFAPVQLAGRHRFLVLKQNTRRSCLSTSFKSNKRIREIPSGCASMRTGWLAARIGYARVRNLTSASSKSYSKTLLLPKTPFPLRPHPSESEAPFRKKTCDDLYKWQWNNAQGPLFVLHDGPPYANGHVHLGHALNKILKDIINRHHVLLGRRVHYVPGWDCHGLPIENKALQELGKDHSSLPPSAIRSAARATALREMEIQREEFMQFGIMADWHGERGTYCTMDHDYEMRQLRIFQRMVENGLIYTAHRPVSYSPSSRSALAEAELEYVDNHVSTAVYVALVLDGPGDTQIHPELKALLDEGSRVEILVWTTTPWTLSANMAIAVHSELVYTVLRVASDNQRVMIVVCDRLEALSEVIGPFELLFEVNGSELVGLAYRPLFPSPGTSSKSYKIIPATHVTAAAGTGLVHCAPAHGVEDYNAFRALGLLPRSAEMTCHVDKAGRFTNEVIKVLGQEHGQRLVGLEVLSKGGEEVVEILRGLKPEQGGGRLVHEGKITHRYPYDWKTGKPVITLATEQWFANLDTIKDTAIAVLGDVQFYPEGSRNRLTSHVRTRSEWCISRQRVWGVPIPSLHHEISNKAVLDAQLLDHILSILEQKGAQWWWDGPVEEFVPEALKGEGPWRKGTDTMDVWFDSGTSWSMLRDDIGNGRKFDADLCLEGSDQHRGWFQSLLLTAVASSSPAEESGHMRYPYGALLTHGMVLDEQGRKMSKSLGNVKSPMDIINGGKDSNKEPAYGADVLRLWVASIEHGNDVNFGHTVLAACVEAFRKIRNTARFILGNLGAGGNEPWTLVERTDMGLAERYVMHELWKLEDTAREAYASYNFPKVANSLTNFANLTLSSLYFDITKDCLYTQPRDSKERRAVLTVFTQVLRTMTNVMAPILPHLAEEIHGHLDPCAAEKSVFCNKWEYLGTEWCDHQAESDMKILFELRKVVLSLLEEARKHKDVRSSLEAVVDIVLPGDMSENAQYLDVLQRQEEFLKTLFIVSEASVVDEGSLGTTSPKWVYVDTLPIPDSGEYIAVRLRPAELCKCPRCWTFTRREEEALCKRCSDACQDIGPNLE